MKIPAPFTRTELGFGVSEKQKARIRANSSDERIPKCGFPLERSGLAAIELILIMGVLYANGAPFRTKESQNFVSSIKQKIFKNCVGCKFAIVPKCDIISLITPLFFCPQVQLSARLSLHFQVSANAILRQTISHSGHVRSRPGKCKHIRGDFGDKLSCSRNTVRLKGFARIFSR